MLRLALRSKMIGTTARPTLPYSSHPADPTSSAYDSSSLSVDIQGVPQSSNSWMTPAPGKWRKTTIDMLPEDTLVEIFDFYRLDAIKQSMGRPWKWHRLAHVCRKWRHVISMSPRRLDLRIFCQRNGAPISSTLVSWPTLPLVVRYSASQKSKHMPRHVLVALRRPDRLCEIDLHVTSSMTKLMVETIQKPCKILECILIYVGDTKRSPLLVHGALLGGSAPHLREIKLDGIAFPFPAIRQVLLSTSNLVELHLPTIPNDFYFTPDDLITGLSTLVLLEWLTVGFLSPASSPPPSMTHPPPRRAILPSLKVLHFHGTSEYLEEFMARIDSPALGIIMIELFNQIFFEIPQFGQFIRRQNALGSPDRVSIYHGPGHVDVNISYNSREGNPPKPIGCNFQTKCRRLDWQLSFLTQILSELSHLLSSIHSFMIYSDEVPAQEDMDSTQWLELFRLFTHVTQVTVLERRLIPSIVEALGAEDMSTEIFPELTSLRLLGYPWSSSDSASVRIAAEQFAARRMSSGGRRVNLSTPM